MSILHTFTVESTDHCETPLSAYRDVAPALAEIARLLGKTKVIELCSPGLCPVGPLLRGLAGQTESP